MSNSNGGLVPKIGLALAYEQELCCCLQTCNSVVYVAVMGLVLGQSLMVMSITGILLYAKVYSLYNVLWESIVVVYM